MKTLPMFKAALALLAALFISTAQAPAQDVISVHPLAGADRPAEVPENYVITPFGYFHPSCVRTLTSGSTMLADGRVQHVDGTVEETAQSCAYPHYRVGPTSETKPTINSWVEDIDTTSTSSYGELISTFTVPSAPKKQSNQTVYFFPGFQDTNASGSNISILQPVLTWAGKGPWNISSWNCCLSGTADQSTPVNVSVGDVIYGKISSTCKSGSTSCATWNVLSEDQTTGKSTTLSNTPSDGQVWNWGFGAVLEAYSVTSCKQFPAAGDISFNTTLYNDNLQAISSPGWEGQLQTAGSPQCSYKQTVGSTLELTF